jgi:chromosomal replication initiator protein
VSEELWQRCLTRLEDELPSQQYNMWIRPLQVAASADGAELTLFAPNRFVVDWVRDKYMDRIGEVLGELQSGALPQLRLEVGSSRMPAPSAQSSSPAPASPATPSSGHMRTPELAESKPQPTELGGARKHRSNLNTGFTFATFVEGKSNRMAAAAAQQVAENPASHGYNPLLLYGGVGLGKTHLMHAVGNSCCDATPTPRWCIYTVSVLSRI